MPITHWTLRSRQPTRRRCAGKLFTGAPPPLENEDLSIVFNARKNAEQSKRGRDAKPEVLPTEPSATPDAVRPSVTAAEQPAENQKPGSAARAKRPSREGEAERIARSDGSWTLERNMAKAVKVERAPVVRSLLRTPHSGPISMATQATNPVRSGGALIEPATLLVRKSPVYPAAAKERAISGTVEVRFRINPEGKVYDVRPVNGSPILAEAAMEAVRGWCYAPARLNGAAIDSQASTNIDFNLE